MSIEEMTFEFHDVAAFPIVRSRADAALAGYASRWELEMRKLVDRGEPFVLIFEHERPEETEEDQKHRMLWLKNNKSALAGVCKALISVESDDIQRGQLEAQSANAKKAFGIPTIVVSSVADAEVVAKLILKSTA